MADRDPVIVEREGGGLAVALVAIVVIVILAVVAVWAFANLDVFRGGQGDTDTTETDIEINPPAVLPTVPAIDTPAPAARQPQRWLAGLG